jgi:hypothetical protein
VPLLAISRRSPLDWLGIALVVNANAVAVLVASH